MAGDTNAAADGGGHTRCDDCRERAAAAAQHALYPRSCAGAGGKRFRPAQAAEWVYCMMYCMLHHSSEDDVCEEALPLLANRGAVMPPATLRPTWNLQQS